MTRQRWTYLLKAYGDQSMTPAEWDEFRNGTDRLDTAAQNEIISELWQEEPPNLEAVGWGEAEWQRRIQAIVQIDRAVADPSPATIAVPLSGRPVHRVHFLKTAWFRYAAAILLLMTAIAVYEYFSHTAQPDTGVAQTTPLSVPADVLPGYSRAMLTLSDGKKVELDSAAAETIRDGRLSIHNNNGQLSYGNNKVALYNTMTTPRGGQYALTLADGTRVWLNAASSITYPTAFPGATREVTVTGEAYFEVAKNPRQPFLVNIDNRSTVRVLGTSFNINAYADEQEIKTTLIEGKVVVKGPAATNTIRLIPGQQAVQQEGRIAVTNDTSPQQVLAWKNGLFDFNAATLPEILRQVARWYDVEVVYTAKVPDVTFKGKMYRNVNLSAIIAFFNEMNMHMKLEGNKLVVSP